jgi:hypothetical protein
VENLFFCWRGHWGLLPVAGNRHERRRSAQ